MESSDAEPLILCSYLPGEGHFRSARYRVVPILCTDAFSYWEGLAEHWGHPGPMLNVEHDMEITDDLIAELLDCPKELCAAAYRSHWIATGHPEGRIACGNGSRFTTCTYHEDGQEFAEWSAIGAAKIGHGARIGPLRREPWQLLELAVEDAVARPWHIHWGPRGTEALRHHHW